MHPGISHHLANIKIAEMHAAAERERRVRAAGSARPKSIDAVALGERIHRTLLRLGHALRGAPAGAGA